MRFLITSTSHPISDLIRGATIAVTALTMTACATGTRVTANQFESFKEGETTKAEVVETAGKPQQESQNSDGYSLLYNYSKDASGALNTPYVNSFLYRLPVIGQLIGPATRGRRESTMCTFIFNRQKLLTQKSCSESQQGGGVPF